MNQTPENKEERCVGCTNGNDHPFNDKCYTPKYEDSTPPLHTEDWEKGLSLIHQNWLKEPGTCNFDDVEILVNRIKSFIRQAVQAERGRYEKLWDETPKYCEKCGDFDFEDKVRQAERIRIFRLIKDYDYKEKHLCRFNDGKSNCECFIGGLNVALSAIDPKPNE